MGHISLKKKILFSIFVLIIVFVLLEAGLWASGFQYSQFPKAMQQNRINWWTSSENGLFEFVPHSTRMWQLKPNISMSNDRGYQGSVVSINKDAGLKRILFLGDSCTNAGPGHYPEKTIAKLKSDFGVNAQAIIAGTPGYTSYQGLKWLPEFLDHKPDALVVYFGWNDHWYAMGGGPDNDFKPLSQAHIKTTEIFGDFRFFQLLHFLIYPPKQYKQDSSKENSTVGMMNFMEYVRVPPDFYKSNINQVISIARDSGMDIYFIRPPHGKHIDRQQIPTVPTQFRDEVSILHESYNYLLEEAVAGHDDVKLVSFKDVDFDRALIMADGVHPTEKGNDLIAERLVSKMRETSSLFLPDSNRVIPISNITLQD